MTEAQIKYMVDRFLGWKLPENFNPDCGISFTRMFNEHTAHPMKHEPIGTNLFDATQAQAMVHYMVEGMAADTITNPATEAVMAKLADRFSEILSPAIDMRAPYAKQMLAALLVAAIEATRPVIPRAGAVPSKEDVVAIMHQYRQGAIRLADDAADQILALIHRASAGPTLNDVVITHALEIMRLRAALQEILDDDEMTGAEAMAIATRALTPQQSSGQRQPE